VVIAPLLPYTLGLAPCLLASFPELKIKLKGQRVQTMSDIQKGSASSTRENDFHGVFEAWEKRWDL
jgi:hypothetical protein